MIDFFELLALAWVAKAAVPTTVKAEEAVALSLTGSAPVEEILPMVRATARGVAANLVLIWATME